MLVKKGQDYEDADIDLSNDDNPLVVNSEESIAATPVEMFSLS